MVVTLTQHLETKHLHGEKQETKITQLVKRLVMRQQQLVKVYVLVIQVVFQEQTLLEKMFTLVTKSQKQILQVMETQF